MWSHGRFVTWILCGLIYCGGVIGYFDIMNYCARNRYNVCLIRNVTFSGDSSIFDGKPILFIHEVKFEDSMLEKIPNIFRLLPNLKQFTAENSGIKSISRDDLFEAGSVEVLDLIFNRIAALPGRVFAEIHGIKDIRLGHNEIEKLQSDTFANASSIVDLQLNGNKIRILPKDLFAPLIMLEYIDLEYNRIELVDASTFRENINLRTVLLNNNNIIVFDSESFAHISQLNLIDVSFNSIKSIVLNSVNTLRAIKSNLTTCNITGTAIRLKLSNNHLKTIDLKDFNQTRDLDIHGNQFESFKAFNGRSLQSLDISYNPISSPDHLDFGQIKLLSELRLSGLNLNISYEIFSDLTRLTLLDISANNLTGLDIRTLRPLQRLEHLYMERNNIVEFDYSQLNMYLPSLKEISIAGNPMSQNFIDKLKNYCESNKIDMSFVHKSLTGIECTQRSPSSGNARTTNGSNAISPLPTSIAIITTIAVVLGLEIVGFICFKMWKRSRDGGVHFENPFWLRFERLTGNSQSVQS